MNNNYNIEKYINLYKKYLTYRIENEQKRVLTTMYLCKIEAYEGEFPAYLNLLDLKNRFEEIDNLNKKRLKRINETNSIIELEHIELEFEVNHDIAMQNLKKLLDSQLENEESDKKP